MPRFEDIYGSFSDRKRCRFDRPGYTKSSIFDLLRCDVRYNKSKIYIRDDNA